MFTTTCSDQRLLLNFRLICLRTKVPRDGGSKGKRIATLLTQQVVWANLAEPFAHLPNQFDWITQAIANRFVVVASCHVAVVGTLNDREFLPSLWLGRQCVLLCGFS